MKKEIKWQNHQKEGKKKKKTKWQNYKMEVKKNRNKVAKL